MAKITVKVTEDHMKKGGTNWNNCPVHHAMYEMGIYAEIFEDRITLGDADKDPGVPRLKTPESVRAFVECWDKKKPDASLPEPFEFDLDIPDQGSP
jgi:hypothetical protein